MKNPKFSLSKKPKKKENETIYFSGFDKIYKLCRQGNRGGGVCIAVHSSIPAVQLNIDSELEVVACKVFFKDFNFNICNVYFNQDANINSVTLTNLINSIPSPKLILGDINGKHYSWGSPICDRRGNIIHEVFADNNMMILNNGLPTYYNVYQNIYSHLDISACSDNIAQKLEWTVHSTKFTSDHFPIFINYDVIDLYTTKPAKWKYAEANWRLYKDVITLPDQFHNPDEANQAIIHNIIQSATAAIPRTGTRAPSKYSCFWWNEQCSEALDNAKRQLRELFRNHTPFNVTEHNRLEAVAQLTLLNSKKESWKQYLSKINKDTPIDQLWRVMKSLSGATRTPHKIILEIEDASVSDPQSLGSNFATFFSNVSSNNNYSETFLLHKVEEEFHPIIFPPTNGEDYNTNFSLKELTNALSSCSNTSPGEDDISYQMIKNLPTHQLNNLLEYFNYLWNNNLFPEQWSTAIVLPFLKPKKPPRLTASYRPISLTSCLCKLFEKMVLVRLSKYMETKKHIKSYQSGFKRLHSTYDPLVALEGAIQETFIRDDFLVAIFIDLEKAYDMVWQQLVLKILQKLELKGNLPNFILNFLKNRKIKVRIGDTLSEPIDVDNGLPQGSVLSCILFLLIINSIFEELEEDVYKALFCDDGLFWATGKNLNDVIKTIQKALNCISEWCDYHGPKISITKTHFNIFTRKTKFVTPELFLNGTQLKRYKSVKYLGVIFDQGLTWKLHKNNIVERCQQPLNMMRKASRHDWGGDRTSLKLLYTGLKKLIMHAFSTAMQPKPTSIN